MYRLYCILKEILEESPHGDTANAIDEMTRLWYYLNPADDLGRRETKERT
jgi:hypothetical protein